MLAAIVVTARAQMLAVVVTEMNAVLLVVLVVPSFVVLAGLALVVPAVILVPDAAVSAAMVVPKAGAKAAWLHRDIGIWKQFAAVPDHRDVSTLQPTYTRLTATAQAIFHTHSHRKT